MSEEVPVISSIYMSERFEQESNVRLQVVVERRGSPAEAFGVTYKKVLKRSPQLNG